MYLTEHLSCRVKHKTQPHHGLWWRFLLEVERLSGDQLVKPCPLSICYREASHHHWVLLDLQCQRCRWKDHRTEDNKEYLHQIHSISQDVTLQCGGESVKAHRLVLALCRYSFVPWQGVLESSWLKFQLFSFSEWFRTVLESLPPSTPHPVLVLWDARYLHWWTINNLTILLGYTERWLILASPADMGLLCDFMYHGQVNVQQDRLPRFVL